jgi:hypothetical protein
MSEDLGDQREVLYTSRVSSSQSLRTDLLREIAILWAASHAMFASLILESEQQRLLMFALDT